jgi:integrase
VLRWVLRKVGNSGAIPATNAGYQLAPRSSVATGRKAAVLDRAKWAAIEDPYVRMSLELQAAFFLRRDECLLIKPHHADQGDYLVLQGSWTKGGRARCLMIRTPEQREVLDRAKAMVSPTSSMIPAHLTLKQQRNKYTYWAQKVGLLRMHGLRHTGAQDRLEALTGYPAPVKGGPTLQAMSREQVIADTRARLILSSELGHARLGISATYVGSRRTPR